MLDALAAAFGAHSAFDVVGTGGSGDEAIGIARERAPSIMLIDIGMPGGGLEAAGAIVALDPEIRIIMLTASEDSDDVMAALEIGAQGYALKGLAAAELVDIVLAVSRGERYVPPELASALLKDMSRQASSSTTPERCRRDSLTAREEQVLRLVGKGMSNKEIGRELDLQEKTVKHYMTSIMQKLEVKNRTEAAIAAADVMGGGGAPRPSRGARSAFALA
jgi:DNA-binding NarL/FixJ family response regulator